MPTLRRSSTGEFQSLRQLSPKSYLLSCGRLCIAAILLISTAGCRHRRSITANVPSAVPPAQVTLAEVAPTLPVTPVVSRPLLSVPPDAVLPTEVNAEGIAAGNTAGALSVSSDGDLAYDFRLWVPPGRNGMQPELSLNYRGRGANGLTGVGWTIGGLSQIARCAQTTAQNGANSPIAFDSSDRFCLDGQQLVAVAGTYGTGNAEYRTERDMFAKVVSGESDGL